MPDASFTWLAQLFEGATGGSRQAVGFWVAVGLLLMFVIAHVVTRMVGQMVPRLDPIIKRYGGPLMLFAAVGFIGYSMGQVSVVLAIAAGSAVAIWWLERRRRRNLHEKIRSQQRATRLAAAGVIALAIAAGATERSLDTSHRRNTRFCLLLSFDSTSVRTDNVVGAWVQFARTWHDVFAGVPGITITPPTAVATDYDKYANDMLVKSLKPDIVLKTRVNIPDQSIHLSSRVHELSHGQLKETDTIFNWAGSIAAMQHSALKGAAFLLRHLHTLKDRPLSDSQHAQAARNLLDAYADFLRVQKGAEAKGILDDVMKSTAGAAAPTSDDRIDTLLGAFDVSAALGADADKEQEARAAALAKLAAVR
jgi:hypothetical protein